MSLSIDSLNGEQRTQQLTQYGQRSKASQQLNQENALRHCEKDDFGDSNIVSGTDKDALQSLELPNSSGDCRSPIELSLRNVGDFNAASLLATQAELKSRLVSKDGKAVLGTNGGVNAPRPNDGIGELDKPHKYLNNDTIYELNRGYTISDPFKFKIIDHFLHNQTIENIIEESHRITCNHHYNYADIGQETVDMKFVYDTNFGELTDALFKYLLSDEFIVYLENLTGIKDIIRDNHEYYGAGIHKIANGGFLALHTDFNIYNHKIHGLVDRRINLLLYLNEDWKNEYNGHLMLCDGEHKKICYKIAPKSNRCVLFNTCKQSIHGHPEKLNLPPNKLRESIALYYYTKNTSICINSAKDLKDYEGEEYHVTNCYNYSEFDATDMKTV
jgi:Rps23 Pro-64 3,4-dihydroxylase Tpa1-like proline 4-hydroxylase